MYWESTFPRRNTQTLCQILLAHGSCYTSTACSKGSAKCWVMCKMSILNDTRTFLHNFRVVVFQAANKLSGSCKPCFPGIFTYDFKCSRTPQHLSQTQDCVSRNPAATYPILNYVVITPPSRSCQFSSLLAPDLGCSQSPLQSPMCLIQCLCPIHSLPTPTSYSHLSLASSTSCSASLEEACTEADYKSEL